MVPRSQLHVPVGRDVEIVSSSHRAHGQRTGRAVVLSPKAASNWKCAESPPPVVTFSERIIAIQLAARGLRRGHSKYKKVFVVGAYAPVSSAPEGERELFLTRRNLQAAVDSAERDALVVAGHPAGEC